MKYVKFMCETPFCETELEEYCAFEDEVMEVELDAVLGDMIYDNAQSFRHCATGWNSDFESEEEQEAYYEDCCGSWVYISKEEYEESKRG